MKIAMLNICKNEMKNIKAYLNYNKDADYICLLDTGSTDGTWEYLQEQAQINPKLIIRQQIFENFRFDIARNESLKLLPDDVDLIVQLDIDEYFYQLNWVDILREKAINDGKKHAYLMWYQNCHFYLSTKLKNLTTAVRVFTPGYVWAFCVHECLTDPDKPYFGFSGDAFVMFKDLIIIHNQDDVKPRQFYINLIKQRLKEPIPKLDEYPELRKAMDSDSVLCLMAEYYRNEMFNEILQLYADYVDGRDDDVFALSTMYLITRDISYIRHGIEELKNGFNGNDVIYYAMLDDLEWCRKYKEDILENIALYEKEVPEQYYQFDELYLAVKELSKQL